MKISPYIYPGIVDLSIKKSKHSIDQKINHIKKAVTEYYSSDIETFEKNIKKRERNFVVQRMIIASFVSELKGMTLKSAGKIIKKDHATVIHSIKTLSNLYFTDKIFKKEINDIAAKLNMNNELLNIIERY
jgi:chromosomal replication initiator protein